jgi:hypothetical protein
VHYRRTCACRVLTATDQHVWDTQRAGRALRNSNSFQ